MTKTERHFYYFRSAVNIIISKYIGFNANKTYLNFFRYRSNNGNKFYCTVLYNFILYYTP